MKYDPLTRTDTYMEVMLFIILANVTNIGYAIIATVAVFGIDYFYKKTILGV